MGIEFLGKLWADEIRNTDIIKQKYDDTSLWDVTH